MNTLLLVCILVGFVLGILFLSFVLGAMITKDYERIWSYILGCLGCVALFVIGYTGYENQYNKNYNNCLNHGYVEVYKKGDSFYCLSFGDEPKIMKLETNNE